MTWLIGQIALRTGLGSLLSSVVVYAIIALVAGGALWGYGYHKYSAGYSAGTAHERTAWEKQRDKDLARQEADKKATQAEIDRLEAELQLDAQAKKDEQADADLKAAQEASATKNETCLPREIGRALNREGR
jgi:uncharacterized protein HemX